MNYICTRSAASYLIDVGAIVVAIPNRPFCPEFVGSESFKVISVLKNGKVYRDYNMVGKTYPVIGSIWEWETVKSVKSIGTVPLTKRQKRKMKGELHGKMEVC